MSAAVSGLEDVTRGLCWRPCSGLDSSLSLESLSGQPCLLRLRLLSSTRHRLCWPPPSDLPVHLHCLLRYLIHRVQHLILHRRLALRLLLLRRRRSLLLLLLRLLLLLHLLLLFHLLLLLHLLLWLRVLHLLCLRCHVTPSLLLRCPHRLPSRQSSLPQKNPQHQHPSQAQGPPHQLPHHRYLPLPHV